jgi:tRNA (pseudouridine54-N1)-methyltransferase
LNPDERTTAALLKKALSLNATDRWIRSTPGIYVRTGGLADLQVLREMPIYYLREDGFDVRDLDLKRDSNAAVEEAVFVLGDHIGVSQDDESLLEDLSSKVISVGPISLHADHCIVLINNELDRREASP